MDYLEIIDRSDSGEYISEENWDLEKVAMTCMRLVSQYDLKWDRQNLVPDDPALADRVFAAGLALAVEIGAYNRSSERILRFERDELESALRDMKQTLSMGQGADERVLFARQIEDSRPPLVWAGNPGAPHPEALFLPAVVSWAQEPIVDLITCGTLAEVDGREVRTGEALEITATRRELTYLHQALAHVGRPGMGMLAAQSSVSELGDLAAANPDYLRTCDAHLVPMLNELKIDNRNIARAVNSIEYGMRNGGLYCAISGGLGGDAPGCALISVASMILGLLTNRADYHILHPIHIRHVATSTREVLWVESVVLQAFARNAPAIIVTDVYPKSGALTRELLYETAANALAITVSGGHLEGCGSADGLVPHATGLEPRLMGEVGHAACRQGVTRAQANQWILQLMEKYEHVFRMPEGNPGARFDQAYDLETLQPLPEWTRMYEEVKTELKEMGLDLSG
ncbi:monomethylamine:corrinoid methyltransferase [Pelolinea submarina]|uniref:Monomethylamine:corrinoid methyltransferase n=1 Tax=Pelolinea submarina TaxID=913107 RepID=A0A347ZWT5_9CHLR|nr:monomethylamine:corrinoid methyltransferase [Pelolinea submarina]REG05509.1 monomethylamine:corrinoid methyltransferase [Pelolinea submarina]BBB49766.1 methylamine---corrinoid protein Co-methyltransferase [Pelolinea submarina]